MERISGTLVSGRRRQPPMIAEIRLPVVPDALITSSPRPLEGLLLDPLQIPMILSNMLSYLPLIDLLMARQANSFWNQEATPFLRKMAVINLTQYYKEDPLIKIERLGDYLNCYERDDYRHQNFFIRPINTLAKTAARLRAWSQVEEFFQKYGGNVKKLIFMDSVLNPHIQQRVLSLTPHLVELHLHCNFSYGSRSDEIRHLGHWAIGRWSRQDAEEIETDPHQFQFLKVLILEVPAPSNTFFQYDVPQLEPFVHGILRRSQNLCTLKFGESHHLFMELVLSLLSDLELAANLEYINIRNLSHNRCFLKELNELVGRGLKGIDFGRVQDSDLPELLTALRTFSNTLEEFKVTIVQASEDFVGFRFPRLPKIQRMSVHWDDCGSGAGKQFIDVLGIYQLFSSRAELESTLPRLSSLEFIIPGGYPISSYDLIFPVTPNGETFPQIRVLNVDYPLVGTEEYKCWVQRLAKLFPNVHNPHVC